MNHWQGKWALITGASAGIGTALARELAAGGTNLVLTARRRDRLAGLAAELSAKHDIRTLICVADLAQPLGPQQIFSFTEEKNIAIDLLVNNAGFGAYGEFRRVPLDRLVEMTQVNVTAVVHMTHLYLPGMIARGNGDIFYRSILAARLRCPVPAAGAEILGEGKYYSAASLWPSRAFNLWISSSAASAITVPGGKIASAPAL